MSITSALYTGVSSLLSFGNSMAVIGNNVANVNTVGFKASRAEFADLLSTVDRGLEIGRGVNLAAVSRPFLQGALQVTESITDLAIQGSGLFIVKNSSGSSFYTRAGQFTLDENGNLANPEGLTVQGFQGGAGTPGGQLGDITIDRTLVLPAVVTTTIGLAANLDAAASVPTAALPVDAVGTEETKANWVAASNFSTVATTFDSLGEAHDLTFLFRKSAANEWSYRVGANAGEITGGTAGQLRQVSAPGGRLAFNDDGSLNSAGSTTITQIGAIAWANGASSQTITAANVQFAGTTQFALPSSVRSLSQDGAESGSLIGIEIDDEGVISGQFSNSGIMDLYQIALADFSSEEGLEALGDSLFTQSLDSGVAQIGASGTNGLGTMVSRAVEISTVDLAREFVSMINSQRAFQVNSRVVTVADRMYDEAVNLKG